MQNGLKQILKTPAPWIVGVLNITPDSFSDGGLFSSEKKALAHAKELSAAGAHIIEIGGESSGPGQTPISAKEELSRIHTVIKETASQHIIAVDTYKASVAKKCIHSGAKIINDVSALRADPRMVDVVSDTGVYVVIMYSKESGTRPHATSTPCNYDNIIETIADFLEERIDFATQRGIRRDHIILDPGMGGFLSPNHKYSWELLRRFNELALLFPDFPFLIGTSRKGFLEGDIKSRDPISQLTALSTYLKGASFLRTHKPAMMKNFINTWNKIHVL